MHEKLLILFFGEFSLGWKKIHTVSFILAVYNRRAEPRAHNEGRISQGNAKNGFPMIWFVPSERPKHTVSAIQKTEKTVDMIKKNRSSISLLLYFMNGSILFFALSMMFALVTTFLDMFIPKVIRVTVDSIVGSGTAEVPQIITAVTGASSTADVNPAAAAAIIILAAAVSAVIRFLFRYCNAYAAGRLEKDMRDKVHEKLMKLPYEWYSANPPGDIMQRCTSDIDTVKDFISEQSTSLMRVFVLITLAVYYMIKINAEMAAISSVFIPVTIALSVFFFSAAERGFKKAEEKVSLLSTALQENIAGVRIVRTFGREGWEKERFEQKNRDFTQAKNEFAKVSMYRTAVMTAITGIQYLVVNITGAVFCMNGLITAGQFIEFIYYSNMLAGPVRRVGEYVTEMGKAWVSLERIRYIMDAAPESSAGYTGVPINEDISFEHVSFRYKGKKDNAVSNISFAVKQGYTVGILGETGSGKSTLMYLLEKIYTPDRGRITIGGTDIKNINSAYLRSRIRMVPQDPYLFSRSIGDNISIAAEGAEGEDIINAARTAGVLDAVNGFTNGFDTVIGERGITLSGGQKQRVAIAQAVIKDCDILIFDDSLSSVDAETSSAIKENLKNIAKDKTVFFITHRTADVMDADLIILMKDGEIIEQGNHSDLMRIGGEYRRIYSMQAQERNDEKKERKETDTAGRT